MRTLWLFPLVLLWDTTSDAAELNNNLLTDIVTRFRVVAASKGPSGSGAERQFAFLLALTANQCGNAQFNGYVPSGDDGGAPVIGGNTADFLNEPLANYMAVYPKGGKRCSENKLLYTNVPSGQEPSNTSPAKDFQNLLNNRGLQVGCVILYTTYTPCIRRCFSDDENYEIIAPLQREPFTPTWANQNIHKYFVFSEVYGPDNNANLLTTIRNKLGQIHNAGFGIRRCRVNQNRNQIECDDCNHPHYCIAQTTH